MLTHCIPVFRMYFMLSLIKLNNTRLNAKMLQSEAMLLVGKWKDAIFVVKKQHLNFLSPTTCNKLWDSASTAPSVYPVKLQVL